MLVIRLQRRGRKGLALYRVVVQDSRVSPSTEKVVARLGSYNPHTKEAKLDKDASQKYLDNGAQPSPRVILLLKEVGVKMPAWVKETPKREDSVKNAEKLRKNQPKEAPSEELADSNDEKKPEDESKAEDNADEAASDQPEAEEKAKTEPSDEPKSAE